MADNMADNGVRWDEPSHGGWESVCRLAERAADAELADLAARLLHWPDRLRSMPDRWWAEWTRGEHRPWHALATHRTLCRPGLDFPVSVLACPDDLRVVLFGEGATGNSDPGEVVLLAPVAEDDGDDHDLTELVVATLGELSAVDGLFGQDGKRVSVSYEDADPVTYGVDGAELYEIALEPGEDDAGRSDDCFARLGQSADGRLLVAGQGATGVVTVVDAASGEVVLTAGGAVGPVALDATGQLVAVAAAEGEVVLRSVATGAVLSSCATGLTEVTALAFAPDGGGVVAAGHAESDDEPVAAMCVLAVAAGRLSVSGVATGGPVDPDGVFIRGWSRACWSATGPRVFVATDERAELLGRGGVLLTSDTAQAVGGFTPDGGCLVTYGGPTGTVDAWFVDTLTGAGPAG